jgi:hypothetical protein
MEIAMMYRQGDVLITTAAIPSGATKTSPGSRGHVLAEGEATGHAHVVSPAHVLAYLVGLEMYLRVLRETPVEHEEHDAITLPPGDYRVTRQREYTPEEIRNVAD